MAAYNRQTKQFQDGFDLTGSDLNTAIADLKSWVLAQGVTGPVQPGVSPSTILSRSGAPITLRNGSYLLKR